MNAVLFYLLAGSVLASAIGVVRQTNLFHAAISLIGCFLGVAGLYITLSAPFMAAMQVLIYAGAISVILLFAFMLTHDLMKGPEPSAQRKSAISVSFMLAAMLCFTSWNTSWVIEGAPPKVLRDVEQLGFTYMTANLLPFQIVAVLLLAALIGAVVIARKEETRPDA
jgi:NADH:ubiquinone oxidoreductase subunit 6 (subunit J)